MASASGVRGGPRGETKASFGGRHAPTLTLALPQAVRDLCSGPWVHTCTLFFDINTLNDIQCM